ncbi:MAG: hypothetical protein R3A10_14650 [Caldilineaceae bacterium]
MAAESLTRSCRRRSTPWPGRISPPRPRPTASAPTPPTARAWPACPPSATACEADAHVINERLQIDDLVAAANGYPGDY